MVSNDTLTWTQVWNRTVAQMVRNQYDPVRVALPISLRAAPVAFNWVFTGAPCYALGVWMDDITFPTIPPSADTMLLGKAPKAPLPSPAICSALSAFCKAPGGPGAAAEVPGAGRRLKHLARA